MSKEKIVNLIVGVLVVAFFFYGLFLAITDANGEKNHQQIQTLQTQEQSSLEATGIRTSFHP